MSAYAPFRLALLLPFALFAFMLLATAETATAPLPACAFEDRLTPHSDYDDWRITLVDPRYRLPEGYAPPDLVSVSEAGLPGRGQVRALVIEDLRALVAAARAEGFDLVSLSAYRSYAYQVQTFNSWVNRLGLERALQVSARPGHSEHQLGTAIDFGTLGGPAAWDMDDWAQTPEGAWLAKNAHRFGFVMSYPKGAQETVCYDYEPWHYRYVGREAAAEIFSSGLTLREWLWQQQRFESADEL